jgi:putative aldouronate transport system permease protein
MNAYSAKKSNVSPLPKKAFRRKLDIALYCMLLPTLAYFIIFRVIPIYNMRLAFFDFKARGPWVFAGMKYIKQIFATPAFYDILRNTLIISFMKYVLLFPFFALFAVSVFELRSNRFRKYVQVVSYLPHFLSWVVIAGIWMSFLSTSNGAVNEIIVRMGGQPIDFLTDKGKIRWILMLCEGWRSLGWDSIIYCTTILAIPQSLFESAEIDGAKRLPIILHIILPALVTPMVTMFILNLGFFLNAGFDQVFNFTNNSVNSVIDILDTYIYRVGLGNGQYSLSTAVSLVKGVVGVFLVLGTHFASKKLTGKGVW